MCWGAVCSLIIVSHSLCLPKYEFTTVKENSAWAGQIHKVHSTLKISLLMCRLHTVHLKKGSWSGKLAFWKMLRGWDVLLSVLGNLSVNSHMEAWKTSHQFDWFYYAHVFEWHWIKAKVHCQHRAAGRYILAHSCTSWQDKQILGLYMHVL